MKKLLSILLVICLAALTLCACGESGNDKKSEGSQTASQADDKGTSKAASTFSYKLKATKLKSLNIKGDEFTYDNVGIIYKSGDNYGLVSPDGANDTGAKFYQLKQLTYDNSYYALGVTSKPAASEQNYIGLYNSKGEQLIPEQYASIDFINDRYVKVVKVDKETKNKDDALVYSTNRLISISPSDEDILYSGTWYVFDLEKGDLVKGVSGTKPYYISAKGGYLIYKNDDGKELKRDGNGKEVTDERQILNDGGYYFSNSDGSQTVYDAEDNKLFTLSKSDGLVSDVKDGYYKVSKYDDGNSSYYVVDKTGKAVTKEFSDSLYLLDGGLMSVNDQIYTIKGEKVLDFGSTANIEKTFKDASYVKDGDKYAVIDTAGNVLCREDSSDVEKSGFCAYKKGDSENSFYCFKTQKFSVKGKYFGDWLCTKTTDGKSTLYDLRSGDPLIEGDYDLYEVMMDNENGVYYIAAFNDYYKAKGQFDIFEVKAE